MGEVERRLEALRWPDGPRCPACGSGEVGGSLQRRRCRVCRLPFRWSTRTALHATKLPASAWMCAARLERPDGASVAAALGCSAPTARRVAALMGAAGVPQSSAPEAKLRALLAAAPPSPRRAGRRGPAPVGQRLQRQVGSLTRSERLVIAALRQRVFGATVHMISALSGVSAGHVRRCLRRIERLGWAVCEARPRLWGYRQLRLRMWRLTWSGSCAEMLGLIPPDLVEEPARGFDDTVPPEFWFFNFWSGTPADKLRVSTDGLLIAETLLTGQDPAARLWALAELPVDVLAQCRQLRGCDSGPIAADIDAAIASRCG